MPASEPLEPPVARQRMPLGEAAGRILLVEADPLLREILASGLELHNRRYRTTAVAEALSAYEALAAAEHDLVLAGMESPPPADLLRFLEVLREVFPSVPVLLMADEATGARASAYDARVPRPPEMDELLAHADRLVRRSRQSVVRGISLPSLLQVIELERKTCTLRVGSGESHGLIGVRGGELVHARVGALSGKEALFAILGWPAPGISLEESCDEETTLSGGAQKLLLEFYVREDHQRR